MPSMKTPIGDVPQTKAVETNVKEPAESLPAEDANSVETKAEVEEQNVQLEEADLKDVKEGQKVPYKRFKEKLDEAKQFKSELEKAHEKYQDEIRRLTLEKEALKNLQTPNDSYVLDIPDESDKKVKTLEHQVGELSRTVERLISKTSEQDLRGQLQQLKTLYPDMDETEVLGWKKAKPDESLHELAELSHVRINERAEKKLAQILEAKKKKAKDVVPLKDFGIKLNPNEKPKSVKEANSILKRFLRQ